MISVVIPTLNAERHLGRTLAALVPAAVEGIVREVIIADGGSTDATLKIADQAGTAIVSSAPGRGVQLKAGASAARFPWLLFLHADTVLEAGAIEEAAEFIERIDNGQRRPTAAVFRLRFDDEGLAPRLVEKVVAVRTRALKLPYGDQGLLVPRALYDELGGFSELPLMEDVDIVWRLGRSRISVFRSHAKTSAERYKQEGYVRRSLRNLACLSLYLLRVPPGRIAKLYEASPESPRTA